VRSAWKRRGGCYAFGVSPDQEERVCDALVDLGWLENDHALHAKAVIAIGPSWGARLMRRERFLTSVNLQAH
jgi:hypothetical protein